MDKNENKMHSVAIPSPKQIYDYLNQYVIGQNEAKKALSVAVYNHYKRFLINVYGASNSNDRPDLEDVFIDKSNLLLLGPTGSGKTFMIKTIAKYLGIPCYIADATKITESGYVGDDVESILSGLLRECDYNIEAAQCGIVCIDEIDKISRKGENVSITRDVSGEGVQQSLLKIVEGCKIGVPPQGGRKHPEQSVIEIDTTNILFIGMGAFDGIERKIEKRLNTNSIGFNSKIKEKNCNKNNILSNVTTSDLRSFGLIPELIGRFPIIAYTNPLTEQDLVSILKEPKNAIIKQYQKMMAIDGIELNFKNDALLEIAKIASETKTGARGLRSIIEKVLTDIMFEYGGNAEVKKINITKDYINRFFENKKAA